MMRWRKKKRDKDKDKGKEKEKDKEKENVRGKENGKNSAECRSNSPKVHNSVQVQHQRL
jgi:hypothetical protein